MRADMPTRTLSEWQDDHTARDENGDWWVRFGRFDAVRSDLAARDAEVAALKRILREAAFFIRQSHAESEFPMTRQNAGLWLHSFDSLQGVAHD